MWSLWMQRDKCKHGEALLPLRQAVFWVRDTALDLWQILHPQIELAKTASKALWSLPDEGWVKCNTDGVLLQDTGAGAVLRNDAGMFLRDRNPALSPRATRGMTPAATYRTRTGQLPLPPPLPSGRRWRWPAAAPKWATRSCFLPPPFLS